jgi:hypothetical protein
MSASETLQHLEAIDWHHVLDHLEADTHVEGVLQVQISVCTKVSDQLVVVIDEVVLTDHVRPLR